MQVKTGINIDKNCTNDKYLPSGPESRHFLAEGTLIYIVVYYASLRIIATLASIFHER